MSSFPQVSRREFLGTGAAAGGALMVGFVMPGWAASPGTKTMLPNSWVVVGSDNSVTILCARSEMGQGVYTSMPMLIAEELGVDIAKIKIEMAPPGEPYINEMIGGQLTGGSTSVREAYSKLRVAGAQARSVLLEAAAQKWNVKADACRAENAMVLGPGGQKATYGELAEAASKLTPPKTPALKSPKDFRYVGKEIKRFDTPAKVNGTAEFGIDVKLPGMGIAVLAQCPALGGTLASFDASRAMAMPGVKKVVQVTDGVAVVADTYWHARKALSAVSIKWDESAVQNLSSAGIASELRAAAAKPGATFKTVGDADAAMREASKKLEAEYELPYTAHVTMEPMNFTADVRADSCLLVGPTQFQQMAQGVAAGMLKMKPEQVTVRTTFLGGGFGRRIDVDFITQAIEISKAAGMPVKLIWSREDDMTHDFYRPASVHRMSGGLDASGKPVAFKFSVASPSVTKRLFGAFVKDGIDPFMLEYAPLPYDIPNQGGNSVIHDTGVRVGYLRSVSHAMNAFANEGFIDEMAAAAGKDPVQFRRDLLIKEPRYLRVLNRAAHEAEWGKAMPAGRKQGVAIMEGYGTYLALIAEVSAPNKQIKVHKITIAVDLGSMVNPNIVKQQIESSIIYGMSSVLFDEITIVGGRVQQKNFNDYRATRMHETPVIDMHIIADGQAPGGIGEPGTAMVGPAVANALASLTGQRLRRLPLKLA
ncbi:MAG: xanthine dehydrogenase family protein molybdopterin-binding subunit [Burkholderiales bacterium]|jgi:isoquinoline 1-oxidoreductase beta subunit|nr:xanthine dehydrogenase family protein molybdopterin-binding subunit [Burkholderiales bacterium]